MKSERKTTQILRSPSSLSQCLFIVHLRFFIRYFQCEISSSKYFEFIKMWKIYVSLYYIVIISPVHARKWLAKIIKDINKCINTIHLISSSFLLPYIQWFEQIIDT